MANVNSPATIKKNRAAAKLKTSLESLLPHLVLSPAEQSARDKAAHKALLMTQQNVSAGNPQPERVMTNSFPSNGGLPWHPSSATTSSGYAQRIVTDYVPIGEIVQTGDTFAKAIASATGKTSINSYDSNVWRGLGPGTIGSPRVSYIAAAYERYWLNSVDVRVVCPGTASAKVGYVVLIACEWNQALSNITQLNGRYSITPYSTDKTASLSVPASWFRNDERGQYFSKVSPIEGFKDMCLLAFMYGEKGDSGPALVPLNLEAKLDYCCFMPCDAVANVADVEVLSSTSSSYECYNPYRTYSGGDTNFFLRLKAREDNHKLLVPVTIYAPDNHFKSFHGTGKQMQVSGSIDLLVNSSNPDGFYTQCSLVLYEDELPYKPIIKTLVRVTEKNDESSSHFRSVTGSLDIDCTFKSRPGRVYSLGMQIENKSTQVTMKFGGHITFKTLPGTKVLAEVTYPFATLLHNLEVTPLKEVETSCTLTDPTLVDDDAYGKFISDDGYSAGDSPRPSLPSGGDAVAEIFRDNGVPLPGIGDDRHTLSSAGRSDAGVRRSDALRATAVEREPSIKPGPRHG